MIDKQIIIPGAPKSGTTNLFFTICKHENVSTPREKEPHFFSLQTKTIKDNTQWYISLYENKGTKIDASTSYLYSKRAVKHIKKFVSNPYVIVILRDPAKRAFSQYKHMIKQVPRADKRDFSKIIRKLDVDDPRGVIEVENNYTKKSIVNGAIDGDYYDSNYLSRYCNAPFKSHFEDPNWQYKYIQNSMYHVHTRRLVRELGSKVKIIFFEELVNDPISQIKEILSFADLCNTDIRLSNIKNKTRAPRGPITRLLKYVRNNTMLGNQIGHIAKLLRSMGYENVVEKLRDEVIYYNPSLPREEYVRTKDLLSFEYKYWFEKNPKLRKMWAY